LPTDLADYTLYDDSNTIMTMPSTQVNALHEHSTARQFEQHKQAIEARLTELLSHHDAPRSVLTDAMHSAVLGSGKRVRPLLLLFIASDLGHDAPSILDLACAIEIVHAASLILDDLPCMDDATLRRGQRTSHLQFGEDVTVLAAVALLSRAFQIVSGADGISPAARARLTTVLAQAVGAQGLARGQFQDLHGAHQRSAAEIAETNALKTTALLGVAIEMAIIVADPDVDVTRCLQAFASAAGQAFQIRDDLLDAGTGPALEAGDIVGKNTGQDIGKATIPHTLGAGQARRRMEKEVLRADQHLYHALGPRNQTRSLLAALFPQCGLPFRPAPPPA